MKDLQKPRLVSRFALSSFVAFVVVGIGLSLVVTRHIRERQEEFAKFHSVFLVESLLRYELTPADLAGPLDPGGNRHRALLQLVQARVVQPPVVRVKIYRRDGTVVFSDEPRLIGTVAEAGGEVAEALEGKIVTEVSELTADENIYERSLAPKLFEAYIPLFLFPSEGGSPSGVVEVYTDYAGIEAEIERMLWTIVVALLVGLAALYILLLPIGRRVSLRLSEQNRQLEEQAEHLTEAVHAEQRTVAELRELNRLKDDFVAMASHEVRTPLTSIIGYAKTLRRPEFAEDPPAREEFLQAIERQGTRLSQLVENLLATSQIESDRNQLTLSPVPFAEVATAVVEGLGPRAKRVRLELQPGLPDIPSDPQRIELVVTNLLDNALKFSPDQTHVVLGAGVEDSWLAFWVQDYGIGIATEHTDRIFERFYQIDSSITRRFGGVGLGLSLVLELVSSLGGRIDVTSQPGQGSRFTVRLPVEPPPEVGELRVPSAIHGTAAMGGG
jgi:signal transduction histidine kinase